MNRRLAALTLALPLFGCPEPPPEALAGPASSAQGLCELTSRGAANYSGVFLGSFSAALTLAFERCTAEEPLAFDGSFWIGDDPEYVARVRESCATPESQQLYQDLLSRGNIAINDFQVEQCRQLGRQYRESVDLEILLYEPEEASTNVSQEDVDAACANVVVGRLGDGQSCRASIECMTGLSCQWMQEEGDLQCKGPAAEGESCVGSPAGGRACGPGLTCFDDVCTRRLAEGAACGGDVPSCAADLFCTTFLEVPVCASPGSEGAACDFDSQCRDGLVCFRGDDEEERCTAPRSAGQSCADAPCAANLFCNQDQLCTEPRAAGASCSLGDVCATPCSVCRPEEVGAEAYRCLDRSPDGGPCAGYNDCRHGLYCDEGVCRAQKAAGETCTSYQECRSGDCDYSNDVCAPEEVEEAIACSPSCDEGETCGEDDDCLGGLLCVDATCQPAPAFGEPCLEGRCGEQAFCDRDVGQSGECRQRFAEGAVCTSDQECLSSFCFSDDGAAEGVCGPVQIGGCWFTQEVFPTLVFFSGFLFAVRLRRLRRVGAPGLRTHPRRGPHQAS